MTVENANRHAEMSCRLIQPANYELTQRGDRAQASAKASAPEAFAVKAIAEDRQWRPGSHDLRRDIMDLMAVEFDQPVFISLPEAADALYNNFYEGRRHEWQMRERLA